ncbi:hypothetical protein Tco_1191788 [Tanacetum coccineum]
MQLQLLLAGMVVAASGDSFDHTPDHLLSEKIKPLPEDENEEDSETDSSGIESLNSDTYDDCLATFSGLIPGVRDNGPEIVLLEDLKTKLSPDAKILSSPTSMNDEMLSMLVVTYKTLNEDKFNSLSASYDQFSENMYAYCLRFVKRWTYNWERDVAIAMFQELIQQKAHDTLYHGHFVLHFWSATMVIAGTLRFEARGKIHLKKNLLDRISSISIGSSDVQLSESPYLPVLFIGMSQSRHHDKSESGRSFGNVLFAIKPFENQSSGCGGGGSVDVVSIVAVKLEGTPADAVRALKKLVCFRLSIAI